MITPAVLCVVLIAASSVRAGDTDASGLSKFWTDDYKVFDQIYGKTSDKDLYGATLPPAISFDVQKSPIKVEASERKERYTKGKNVLESDFPHDFNDRYAQLFSKSLYSEKTKPSSALQFISLTDFKPISESNNPETYNYLKKLEKKVQKEKELKARPVDTEFDTEANEAYKSIQDILDAHEANKGESSEEIRLKKPKIVHDRPRNRIRSKVRFLNGNGIKSRCVSARCRRPVRTPRPYLKIKHYRYSKR